MDNFYKQWLKAANDDILLMEKILDDAQLTNILSFHAQQAIEKSFKALLEYKNLKVLKTHSLSKLLNLLSDDISIEDVDTIELIDSLYIESRYPGDSGLLPYGKPTLEDTKLFYNLAIKINKEIIQLTNGKIN